MNTQSSTHEPDDALLIAFARAASQAQEIEALLQEMLIAAEIANDTNELLGNHRRSPRQSGLDVGLFIAD
jgi:hypothetical protein